MLKREIISKDKVKDEIPKLVSAKTQIPLPVVEAVLSFTFNECKKAFKSNQQVEISGFGKFKLIPSRVQRKLDKVESKIAYIQQELQNDISEAKKRNLTLKLHTAQADLEYLKSIT